MDFEWKHRRATYYALNPMEEQEDALGEDEGDYVNEGNQYIVIHKTEDIVEDAYNYLFGEPDMLIYPAKSYAIATLYGFYLAAEFGGAPQDYWKQEDLLPGDPHFIPYVESSKSIYNRLMTKIFMDKFGGMGAIWTKLGPWGAKTFDYFLKEFMLDESGSKILPRVVQILQTEERGS